MLAPPHQPTVPRRARGEVLRSLSVMLVCLFLLGRLVSSVHLAVVEHGLCPEDGELFHASDVHAGQPTHPRMQVPLRRALPSLQSGCECTETHLHEHCFGSSQRHELLLPQGWAEATALLVPPADTAPAVHHTFPSLKSLRIFRLAPKNSPPV